MITVAESLNLGLPLADLLAGAHGAKSLGPDLEALRGESERWEADRREADRRHRARLLANLKQRQAVGTYSVKALGGNRTKGNKTMSDTNYRQELEQAEREALAQFELAEEIRAAGGMSRQELLEGIKALEIAATNAEILETVRNQQTVLQALSNELAGRLGVKSLFHPSRCECGGECDSCRLLEAGPECVRDPGWCGRHPGSPFCRVVA